MISAWKDSTDLSLGYNDVWGYANEAVGEFAIIGSRTHINFINLNNPSNPYSVSIHEGGDNTSWRDIKTFRHYAYSVCDACSEGLHIFDLSTLPDTATHVNQIDTYFGNAHNIFIENGRLYVVGIQQPADLLIFDLLSDPVNPTLLASVDLKPIIGTTNSMYIHDVFVKGDIAYASHGNTGYFIWDVADPSNVSLIAENVFLGYNHSSWISECGQYAYVAEEVPLGLPAQVVDLRDMMNGNIQSVGTFLDNIGPVGGTNEYNATHHNPFVHNDLLYMANYEDGVKIYDVRDPSDPILYGYYDSYPDNEIAGEYSGYRGVWGTYPYLPSGLLLASDRQYGLQVIDVDLIDCENTVKIIGNETMSENEKYSCCIITGINSRVSNNVQSKYTAEQYIHLGDDFEVVLGSQVLFSIEECEN